MSLRLGTLNDFVSSRPEAQALNLDFMRPSRSNREFTIRDSLQAKIDQQFPNPELGVQELSDAVNYNANSRLLLIDWGWYCTVLKDVCGD